MESFNPNSKTNSASKGLAKPKADPQKKFSPKAVNAEINMISKTIEKVLAAEKEQKLEDACNATVYLARNLDVSKLNGEGVEVSNMEYLIKICNKYATYSLEIGELSQVYDLLEFSLELLGGQNKIEEDNKYNLYVTTFNNMAIYSIKMKDEQIARNFFKKAVRSISSKTSSPFLKALIFNNLASFHLINKEYYKAFKYSEESLIKIESLIFNKIKAGGDKLRGTAKFTSQLIILLNGYYNMGISIKKIISSNSSQAAGNEMITPQNAKKFFNNGYKLAQKFLSPEHIMYKKLEEYSKHRSEEIVNLDSSFEEQNEGTGIHQQANNNNRQRGSRIGDDNNDYSDDLDNSMQSGGHQFSVIRNFGANHTGGNHAWRNRGGKRGQQVYASSLYPNPLGRPYSAQSQSNFFQRNMGEYNEMPPQNWGGIMTSMQNLRPNQYINSAERDDTKTREFEDLIREVKNLKDELHKSKKSDEQGLEDKKVAQTLQKNENISKDQEAKIEALTSIVHNKDRELEEIKRTMVRVEEELKKSTLMQTQLQQQQLQQQILQANAQLNNQPTHTTAPQVSNNNAPFNNNNPSNNINNATAGAKPLATAAISKPAQETVQNNTANNYQAKAGIASALRAEDTSIKGKGGQTDGADNPANKLVQGVNVAPKEEVKKTPSGLHFPSLKSDNSANFPVQKNEFNKNPASNAPLPTTNNAAAKSNVNKPSENKVAQPTERKVVDKNLLAQRNSKTDKEIDFENFLDAVTPVTLLERPEYLSFPKEGSIRKRYFYDDDVYMIECRIITEGKDRHLKLSGYNEKTNKQLREEVLSQEVLKALAAYLFFKDTLPTSQPLKSINNFYQFTKYFILPFIDIGKNEEQNHDINHDIIIKLYPKSNGLFNVPIKKRFMGEDCLVYLNYILNENFRLVISHGKSGDTLRIDINIEQATIKKYLELIDDKGQRSAYLDDIFKIVETLEGEKGDEENSNFIPQILAKHDPNKHQNYLVESYKVINPQGLISQLEKLLTDTEIFLRERGFNRFSEVVEYEESYIYMMIKAWSDLDKYRFYMLKENLQKKSFDLYLKNSFETYAPAKEKIKVKGHKEYSFDSLWKDFGLVHEKMDSNDKQALAPFILMHFTLEVHEKELDQDDYDRFDENPILPVNFQSAAFFRTFVGDSVKNPITFNLIGLENIPIGVKVSLFNFEDCMEHGMFFTINEENWLKPGSSKQAKQKRKYNYTIPLEESYFLKFFLNKVGWKIIMNNIHIESKALHNEVLGRKLYKQYSVIDQLENIMTIENLSILYKNHGDHL